MVTKAKKKIYKIMIKVIINNNKWETQMFSTNKNFFEAPTRKRLMS